jgi:diguanylate cyclase (GGDEF)-like protein
MTDRPLRRRTDLEPNESPALRALVVDDDDNYRFFLSTLVSRYGFTVTGVMDGHYALSAIADAPVFDLLIVDCEMPRLSGLELITAIRAEDRYSDVFAMMITARHDVQTKLSALRLGYDDFMTKSDSEVEIGAKLSVARRLISRQRRLDNAVRELYGLATRDELTGLYNRRHFFTEAERMLTEGRNVNLVMFDLNDFKGINDTFGHQAGDRVLRDMGAMFMSHTRRDDIVARYGGDEFIMLVTDLGPADVAGLAARITGELSSNQWTFEASTFAVTVSAGIACSSLLERPTISQLLNIGDRDLYKNKWLLKHPGRDPALYEYDTARDALVVDFMRDHKIIVRAKE